MSIYTCNCMNQCQTCGQCCRFCACRRPPGTSTTSNITVSWLPAVVPNDEKMRGIGRRIALKFADALRRLAD